MILILEKPINHPKDPFFKFVRFLMRSSILDEFKITEVCLRTTLIL